MALFSASDFTGYPSPAQRSTAWRWHSRARHGNGINTAHGGAVGHSALHRGTPV